MFSGLVCAMHGCGRTRIRSSTGGFDGGGSLEEAGLRRHVSASVAGVDGALRLDE
jgi:hypothetical protein